MADIDYTSEEYALLSEEYEYEWHKNHDLEMTQYKKEINECLSSKTPESYNRLKVLFNNPTFKDTYCLKHDFAYMSIIMMIYTEEENSRVPYTILDTGKSMDEIIHIVKQLKFYLWRVEFTDDTNALSLIYQYIIEQNLSVFMLNYIIHVSSYDKIALLNKLIAYFTKLNALNYTYSLTKYLHEIDPDNEDALCILSQIAALSDDYQLALYYLSLVKHPSENTERLRKEYEIHQST